MHIPKLWLDTEATGLNPGYHEVIELAVVFDDGSEPEPDDIFVGRIKATKPENADPRSLEVNGLNPEVGESKDIIFKRLTEWWANRIAEFEDPVFVAGWNLLLDLMWLDGDGFDLLNELPQLDYHVFDVWPFAKVCNPRLNKLEEFANYFEIAAHQTHSALDDIFLTREVFHHVRDHDAAE